MNETNRDADFYLIRLSVEVTDEEHWEISEGSVVDPWKDNQMRHAS